MNKISSLVIILLLQAGLIVWLYSGSLSTTGEQTTVQPLIELDVTKINKVTIKNENDKTVVLNKTDNGWVLPDYHQLAVDRGLLEQLFEKVTSVQTTWPVASSAGAAERFQVSKQKFKRHIIFTSTDNTTSEIYLGDSPGLRKIYARNANNTDIHAIELGLYLAPTDAERWFDKRLLKVRKAIDQIQGADFVINKQGDTWKLDGIQDDETLEQDKLDSLINALAYPQVKAVADSQQIEALKGKKADTHYKIQAGGDEISYDFYRIEEDVILKSSLSDLYFVVPIYATESLLDVSRDKLIKEEKKQEPEAN